MKKKIMCVILSLMAVLSLSACTTKEVASDSGEGSADKQVITCGAIVLDPAVEMEIVRFNKLNDTYEIQVRDYAEEADGDEEAAIRQLNFDIINNSGPDILILPVYYSMDLYAEKQVLEDLYPYLDSDEELSREDFLPNVMSAFERDGKLYGFPVCFDVDTMIGPGSLLGDRSSWTLEEMMDIVSGVDANTNFFENSSQSAVINICVKANWSRFVTWQGDSFSFDKELYKQILEFTSKFPQDQSYVHNRKYQERIMEKDLYVLADSASVYHVSCDQIFNSLFKEQVSYIGYPTDGDSGSLIWSATTFSINSRSKNKDGAWEFIRTVLSKEYYERASFVRGFSTRKDVLELQLQEAKDGFAGMMIGEDFNLPEVKHVTQEEVERIRHLVMSVDTMATYDFEITNIMLEEAASYFQGYKSADEVADMVENRIRIYISEMM